MQKSFYIQLKNINKKKTMNDNKKKVSFFNGLYTPIE